MLTLVTIIMKGSSHSRMCVLAKHVNLEFDLVQTPTGIVTLGVLICNTGIMISTGKIGLVWMALSMEPGT